MKAWTADDLRVAYRTLANRGAPRFEELPPRYETPQEIRDRRKMAMAKVRLKAVSKSTYRANVEEHKLYGADTVTEFYVTRLDTRETRVFTVGGVNARAVALQKAAEFWKLKGGPRASLGANYYVWALDAESREPIAEAQGPFGYRQAKDTARLQSREGQHDCIVTEGDDLSNVLRGYEAGTGAIRFRK